MLQSSVLLWYCEYACSDGKVGVGNRHHRRLFLMSKTAWSRASSVPSDRIPPSNASQSNRRKGKDKANDPPKSKEVLRLESQVAALRSVASGKDPKGGCFCQGEDTIASAYFNGFIFL